MPHVRPSCMGANVCDDRRVGRRRGGRRPGGRGEEEGTARPNRPAVPAMTVRFMALSLSTERHRRTCAEYRRAAANVSAERATNTDGKPRKLWLTCALRATGKRARPSMPRHLSHAPRSSPRSSAPSSPAPRSRARRPSRPLPAYAGHAAELFDDVIEPTAVGISLDVGADPRSDRRLRERTQTGDAVLRVRVATLTAKQEDSATRYIIGMRTLEKLVGQFPPADPVRDSSSAGRARRGRDPQGARRAAASARRSSPSCAPSSARTATRSCTFISPPTPRTRSAP